MKMFTLGLSALALVAAGAAVADHHMGDRPDADGDGVLTRAEAQAHSSQMFARMDFNKDGKLDSADREARREQHRSKMFEALDADHNGQISKSEFMSHEHVGPRGKGDEPGMPHRMGRRDGDRGMKMMQMADTNKDGAISQAEFTAGALKHFDMMDSNRDGKVTSEERQAAREAMRAKWREKSGNGPGN